MLTVIGLRQFGISCCERYVTLTLAVNKKSYNIDRVAINLWSNTIKQVWIVLFKNKIYMVLNLASRAHALTLALMMRLKRTHLSFKWRGPSSWNPPSWQHHAVYTTLKAIHAYQNLQKLKAFWNESSVFKTLNIALISLSFLEVKLDTKTCEIKEITHLAFQWRRLVMN